MSEREEGSPPLRSLSLSALVPSSQFGSLSLSSSAEAFRAPSTHRNASSDVPVARQHGQRLAASLSIGELLHRVHRQGSGSVHQGVGEAPHASTSSPRVETLLPPSPSSSCSPSVVKKDTRSSTAKHHHHLHAAAETASSSQNDGKGGVLGPSCVSCFVEQMDVQSSDDEAVLSSTVSPFSFACAADVGDSGASDQHRSLQCESNTAGRTKKTKMMTAQSWGDVYAALHPRSCESSSCCPIRLWEVVYPSPLLRLEKHSTHQRTHTSPVETNCDALPYTPPLLRDVLGLALAHRHHHVLTSPRQAPSASSTTSQQQQQEPVLPSASSLTSCRRVEHALGWLLHHWLPPSLLTTEAGSSGSAPGSRRTIHVVLKLASTPQDAPIRCILVPDATDEDAAFTDNTHLTVYDNTVDCLLEHWHTYAKGVDGVGDAEEPNHGDGVGSEECSVETAQQQRLASLERAFTPLLEMSKGPRDPSQRDSDAAEASASHATTDLVRRISRMMAVAVEASRVERRKLHIQQQPQQNHSPLAPLLDTDEHLVEEVVHHGGHSSLRHHEAWGTEAATTLYTDAEVHNLSQLLFFLLTSERRESHDKEESCARVKKEERSRRLERVQRWLRRRLVQQSPASWLTGESAESQLYAALFAPYAATAVTFSHLLHALGHWLTLNVVSSLVELCNVHISGGATTEESPPGNEEDEDRHATHSVRQESEPRSGDPLSTRSADAPVYVRLCTIPMSREDGASAAAAAAAPSVRRPSRLCHLPPQHSLTALTLSDWLSAMQTPSASSLSGVACENRTAEKTSGDLERPTPSPLPRLNRLRHTFPHLSGTGLRLLYVFESFATDVWEDRPVSCSSPVPWDSVGAISALFTAPYHVPLCRLLVARSSAELHALRCQWRSTVKHSASVHNRKADMCIGVGGMQMEHNASSEEGLHPPPEMDCSSSLSLSSTDTVAWYESGLESKRVRAAHGPCPRDDSFSTPRLLRSALRTWSVDDFLNAFDAHRNESDLAHRGASPRDAATRCRTICRVSGVVLHVVVKEDEDEEDEKHQQLLQQRKQCIGDDNGEGGYRATPCLPSWKGCVVLFSALGLLAVRDVHVLVALQHTRHSSQERQQPCRLSTATDAVATSSSVNGASNVVCSGGQSRGPSPSRGPPHQPPQGTAVMALQTAEHHQRAVLTFLERTGRAHILTEEALCDRRLVEREEADQRATLCARDPKDAFLCSSFYAAQCAEGVGSSREIPPSSPSFTSSRWCWWCPHEASVGATLPFFTSQVAPRTNAGRPRVAEKESSAIASASPSSASFSQPRENSTTSVDDASIMECVLELPETSAAGVSETSSLSGDCSEGHLADTTATTQAACNHLQDLSHRSPTPSTHSEACRAGHSRTRHRDPSRDDVVRAAVQLARHGTPLPPRSLPHPSPVSAGAASVKDENSNHTEAATPTKVTPFTTTSVVNQSTRLPPSTEAASITHTSTAQTTRQSGMLPLHSDSRPLHVLVPANESCVNASATERPPRLSGSQELRGDVVLQARSFRETRFHALREHERQARFTLWRVWLDGLRALYSVASLEELVVVREPLHRRLLLQQARLEHKELRARWRDVMAPYAVVLEMMHTYHARLQADVAAAMAAPLHFSRRAPVPRAERTQQHRVGRVVDASSRGAPRVTKSNALSPPAGSDVPVHTTTAHLARSSDAVPVVKISLTDVHVDEDAKEEEEVEGACASRRETKDAEKFRKSTTRGVRVAVKEKGKPLLSEEPVGALRERNVNRLRTPFVSQSAKSRGTALYRLPSSPRQPTHAFSFSPSNAGRTPMPMAQPSSTTDARHSPSPLKSVCESASTPTGGATTVASSADESRRCRPRDRHVRRAETVAQRARAERALLFDDVDAPHHAPLSASPLSAGRRTSFSVPPSPSATAAVVVAAANDGKRSSAAQREIARVRASVQQEESTRVEDATIQPEKEPKVTVVATNVNPSYAAFSRRRSRPRVVTWADDVVDY